MRQTLIKKAACAMAALVVAGTLYSFQPAATKYTLTGEFKELADGTKIELVPGGAHKREKPVAETVVKNGKFVFTGSVASPRIFYVKIAGEDYSMFRVMVENAAIEVTGKVVEKEMSGSTSHQFNDLKVTGSKAHEEFLKKTSLRDRMGVLYEAYHTNNKEVLDQLKAAGDKKDTVLRKQLLESEAYKKFANDEKQFFTTVEDSIKGLILANKDSWWGPFLMLDQLSYFTPKEKALYEQFSKEAKESYYGKIVQADLYPPSYVGKNAPSLAFVNAEQKPVSFASMAKGKKYVVIDFWASWCNPCRKAIPALKAFYSEAGNKGLGVEIISVSIDKKEADWVKADVAEALPWYSFLDRKGLADAYNVKAIPAMFLLDGNGKVVAENVTLDQIKEKIK
ncbi:thioredoxin-like domain-containing protein [Niastella sp. OAS944]|uniref:thioredoxin-like domain-containing protein n=1 Tax=Niastella sp. OAS944 TaxID=2664089 RepID=UPI00347B0EC6|nr:thiol-disulfide isomerase/thioredoxin [Chitinophagaceae bacterium OAS944]